MSRRQVLAVVALALTVLAVLLAAATLVQAWPRGLIVLAADVLALAAAWYGVVRRGAARVLGLGLAVLLLAAGVVIAVTRSPVLVPATVVCVLASLAAARGAFREHVTLPGATAPSHPVLIYNPKSGGGKAERFHLAEEARKRGIEPIELTPGADLAALVRGAVAEGADAIAVAGGDGSQAIAAAIAAEHGLPYACIPAGTRNHFALDLGVDREDVVGALDAFVDGGERTVDLAEVNGIVFVNNVSLGLYAEAVEREGYRDAKLRTLLDTVPDAVRDRNGRVVALDWRDADGHDGAGAAALLISNNRYRLGRAIGSGTRPRIDEGTLGITVLGAAHRPAWREWTAPAFEVDAAAQVPAGVDGEAMHLEPPLRFRSRPGALHVRIAKHHPGASPSAREPDRPYDVPRALAAIALGRPFTR